MSIRNLHIFLPLIRVLANGVKLLRGFEFVMCGRFLSGLTTGILCFLLPKCQSSVVPPNLFYIYGLASNSGVGFGLLLIGFLAAVLVPIQADGLDSMMLD